MNVGVVIPFYQHEAGILPRALASIRDQNLPADVQLDVIVVDDQSPISASAEMAGFEDSDQIRWHLTTQENTGPGGARNTGIDWLEGRDIRHLAFLDSDDEWHPDHLANGLAALEAGGDFYFSDHGRIDHTPSYFNDDIAVNDTMHDMRTAGPFTNGTHAWMFAPGAINDVMLENYLSQTSTVILRRSFLGDLRFDPELRHAGEDFMLWVHLTLKGARICIADRVEVLCGSGMNMYHGSHDWGSEYVMIRLASELIFLRKLVRLPLGDEARAKKVEEARERRRLYAYLLVSRLAKRSLPTNTGLSLVMRHDPLLLIQMPLLVARFLLQDRRRLALSGDR